MREIKCMTCGSVSSALIRLGESTELVPAWYCDKAEKVIGAKKQIRLVRPHWCPKRETKDEL